MTYYEAALEVLREAGRPLHYRKITKLALEQSLLSHVGKTPDETMHARLAQEVKKPEGESLITTVRTGVFMLKNGVDPAAGKETIRLREPEVSDEEVEEADEAAEEHLDAEAADDGPLVVDDPEVVGRSDRRRRRRGRRGGRNRNRDKDDLATEDDDDDDISTGEEAETPAPTKAASTKADPAAEVPSSSTDERVPNDALRAGIDDIGDVARAAVTILEKRRENAWTLRNIARELSRRGVGSLGRVGTSVLRAELEHTNAMRAAQGRPPLFEELRPNFFALSAASGSELATSYERLDSWQNQHRAALKRALLDRVRKLDDSAIGSVVTLLLDRMGYRSLQSFDPIGDELMTLAAASPRGLTSVQLAVRIAKADKRVTREDVIAFRGALHTYKATEGAMIALAGIDDAASSESNVPNLAPISLIGPNDFADHLIATGVGVSSFTVAVNCLDEMLFVDLNDTKKSSTKKD